jgi:hypothetical protein
MDDALDRRAGRRFGIGLRLVLYPMALGLILLAWREYHGGSSEDGSPTPTGHSERWYGLTSQHYPMRGLSAKGALGFFRATVRQRCSDGSSFIFTWSPLRHEFVQHGDRLSGQEIGGDHDSWGEPYTFEARVWARMDGNPRGTIRIRDRLTRRHHTVRCDSAAVTFALHRAG